MIDLADTLRKARERRGMSQREVARLCDVTMQSVSSWEIGQVVPHFRVVERWARAVGYEIKLTKVA